MTHFFALSDHTLQTLAADTLAYAKSIGATDAAVEVSESMGLSVTTRKMVVETIEHTRDKGLGITVYIGQRRGHASTSDLSTAALRQAVDAAHSIARYTAADDCAGLPDADDLARNIQDLDLFHPWAIETDAAIDLARRCEQAAFDVNPRIVNSEGASVYTSAGHFVLANTRGFMAGYPFSRHSLSVVPIAQDERGMQRDDWYSTSRLPDRLAAPEAIGRYAAQRALARLSARRVPSGSYPVLFEAPLVCGLLGSFVQAASGGALYRGASFLMDALNKPVFAKHISVDEDPLIAQADGSCPFDDEGVRVRARTVVDDGVLRGYFLSTYSARKLKMKTTGNAGGAHNLRLRSSQTNAADDFEAMLRTLGTGLLVTELIGHGVNAVTGDYSRGACGYWVDNGAIAYPVEEITIAGNLRDMYAGIVAVGSDEIVRGSRVSGSVLVDRMSVGGA